MKIFFSTRGKVHRGEHRCAGCKELPLRTKRHISKTVPGLLLKCKQTSPTGRCANCAAVGVSCSLQRYDKSMVRVRMGVSDDVPSENAQRLLQIVKSWAKAPRTKEKKFKVIDPKEITEVQELAEELVEDLDNLEEELQGVPQRYTDADVIVVEDENGQEIDLLNFDGDGE